MPLREDIRSVSYLKSKSADLLRQINETRRPVVITQNGEARGVLQDPESYERMRETMAMLKLLALSEADVNSGKLVDHKQVFSDLRARMKNK